MTKSEIIAECRANPDKIFHLLRENDFERAKKFFGEGLTKFWLTYQEDGHQFAVKSPNGGDYLTLNYQFHMQQLILAPDVLGYLEEHGKEGE